MPTVLRVLCVAVLILGGTDELSRAVAEEAVRQGDKPVDANPALATADPKPKVIVAEGRHLEWIFENGPFSSCQALSTAMTPGGIVCAWLGRAADREFSTIWLGRQLEGRWATREIVGTIRHTYEPGRIQPELVGEPFVFQPRRGPLSIFYRQGTKSDRQTTWVISSADGGETWSVPNRLPEEAGTIDNAPYETEDGSWLLRGKTRHASTDCYLRTRDHGESWQFIATLRVRELLGDTSGNVEIPLPDARRRASGLARDRRFVELETNDGGLTWTGIRTFAPLPRHPWGAAVGWGADGVVGVSPQAIRARSRLGLQASASWSSWKPYYGVINGLPEGDCSDADLLRTDDGRLHVFYVMDKVRLGHGVMEEPRLVDESPTP